MEKKTCMNYDSNEDILSIIKSGHVSHSARIGDVILDFDNSMRIIGIELINATEFFEAFDISKGDLRSIDNARLSVHYSHDWAVTKITIKIKTRQAPIAKDFTIPSLKEQEGLAGIEG